MANISNSNNNTIVRGTDKADSITNTGSNVTISPGSGDDTINLNGSNQVINMLDMHGDNQVYGFDSDDTIFSPYNWYLGFEGDNAIKIDSRLILHNARNKKINLTSGRNGSISSEVAFFNDTIGGKITVDPEIKYFFNASAKATINANGSRVSNQAASVLINGTANNDSISNFGSYAVINAGANNDTIINSGSNATIDAGDSNDVIYNGSYGSCSSISGGAGNDTISNGGSNVTLNAGKGDDLVSLNGALTYINYGAGAGNDTILGFDYSILNITSGSISSASVKGVDVALKVGTGSLVFRNMAGYDFNIFDENDQEYESTIIGGLIFDGSSNNDTINNSQNGAIIRPGNGDDVISLNGARQIIDYEGGNDTVYGLDSDDFIRLWDMYNHWEMSVQGSDVIFTNSYYYYGYNYERKYVNNSLTLKNVAGKKFNVLAVDDEGSTLFVPSTGATVDNNSDINDIKNIFDGVLIDAGNGEKSIYTTGDKVTIRAEGKNDITGLGKNTSVKTGDGDDHVNFYSEEAPPSNITVDAGGGNNSFYIGTNDTVQVGKNIKLKSGNGEDWFHFEDGADSVSIDAGDGTNYIELFGYGTTSDITIKSGAGDDWIYANSYNNRTINAGAGANTIYAGSYDKKTVLKNTSIKTGDGDDSIRVYQTNNVSIESSGGNNMISLNSSYDIHDLENLLIKTGAGDDSIFESGYDSVTIDAGDGNDEINMSNVDWIYDETLKTERFILGKNIKVNAGAGDDHVFIDGIENGTVEGGAGNNHVYLGAAKNVSVNAGSGDDEIWVENGMDDISIDTDDGDNQIYVRYIDEPTSVGDGLNIRAGAGNDTIDAYDYNNTRRLRLQ